MSTHNIHFQNKTKELSNYPKILMSVVMEKNSRTQDQVQIAMVKESSVFEPLKFYCSVDLDQTVPEEQSSHVLQHLTGL